MKHVFVVHSNITFLLMEEIVKYNNLLPNYIVILLGRNYVPPSVDSKKIYINDSPINLEFGKNFIKNRSKMKVWEMEFNKLIKDDYYVYLPHIFALYYRLLVANRSCKGFFYIEEGTLSYTNRFFESPRLTLIRKFRSRIKFMSIRLSKLFSETNLFNFSDRKFLGCYSIDDKAFPIIVPKTVFNLVQNGKMESAYDAIIIFDSASLVNIMTFEELGTLLENVIAPHIKANFMKNKVAFKLHPLHYADELGINEGERIRSLLNEIFPNVTDLGKSFFLEEYFRDYKVNIYTYFSSLGFYGTKFGCKTYSVYSRIENAPNIPLLYSKDIIQI